MRRLGGTCGRRVTSRADLLIRSQPEAPTEELDDFGSPLNTSAYPPIMHGMVAGETRDPLTELRRGVVEHCVLAVIRQKESYAYEIVRALSNAGRLVTSEGTIYPLLSRLRRDGLVETTWRESESGPPRRYYRLTSEGQQALDAFVRDWTRFREAVDAVLAE
jgi:PadR family transcriptional regulator, regulatory protein PadR